MAGNFGPSKVQVGRYEDPFSGGVKALDSIQRQVNVYDAQKAAEERNKLLDARYNKEQEYKDSERKRIADERAKALATEEAVRRIDTGYDISADRRIAGVEDEILSRPELIGSVLSDKEGGSAEQRAQHKKFTEETLAKYDEAGLMDKVDAEKEAYNAYRTAGASREEARAGAAQKVAGMKSRAEKQAALQSQSDRQWKDDQWKFEQDAKAIAEANKNQAKVMAAHAKKYNKSSGDSTGAINTIAKTLEKANITDDETTQFYALVDKLKGEGYTDKQIAAVIPASKEEGYSFFGIGNIYDPEIGEKPLRAALMASFPMDANGKPSRTARTGDGVYNESFKTVGATPTRRPVVETPQRTSDELRKEFIAKMDGTYKAEEKVKDQKPKGTGVVHRGSKKTGGTGGGGGTGTEVLDTVVTSPAAEDPVVIPDKQLEDLTAKVVALSEPKTVKEYDELQDAKKELRIKEATLELEASQRKGGPKLVDNPRFDLWGGAKNLFNKSRTLPKAILGADAALSQDFQRGFEDIIDPRAKYLRAEAQRRYEADPERNIVGGFDVNPKAPVKR